MDGLFAALEQIFPVEIHPDDLDPDSVDRVELTNRLTESAIASYDAREQELGEELMRALERFLLLQIIDERWREHLYDMDYLREGIHLRGFAQIDPLVAYKNEAFELFTDLMNTIWSDFARMIFNVELTVEGPNGGAPQRLAPESSSSTRGSSVSYSSGGPDPRAAMAMAAAGAVEGGEAYAEGAEALGGEPAPAPVQQRRVDDEFAGVGRNDLCPCGSGKKFKACCMRKEAATDR